MKYNIIRSKEKRTIDWWDFLKRPTEWMDI